MISISTSNLHFFFDIICLQNEIHSLPFPLYCTFATRLTKSKKMKHSIIHEILPPEMVEKILKLLNYNEICNAQLVCRRWKEIIEKGNVVKTISGKIPGTSQHFSVIYPKIPFRKDFLHHCCWRVDWRKLFCGSLSW